VKFALVGVGQRARSHIIPALMKCRNAEIAALFASRQRIISACGSNFSVSVFEASDQQTFANVDSVIVCVPQKSIKRVLLNLLDFGCRDKTIFIDTPVLAKRNVVSYSVVAKFSKVVVLEDWLTLPTFSLASSLIRDGKIGKLRRIYFHHSGYRHHALAMIRYWTGSVFFKKGIFFHHSAEVKELVLYDGKGVTTTIVEPREYLNGRFLIVGEHGSVGNYPIPSSNHYFIRVVRERGRLLVSIVEGFFVKNKPLDIVGGNELSNIELQIDGELSGMADMDIMKIYGLMRIFDDQESTNGPTAIYRPLDAIYDRLVVDIMVRSGRVYDFAIPGGSLLKRLIKTFGLIG